jgi:sodium-dependent dicarboxylate transporter 2/3/5
MKFLFLATPPNAMIFSSGSVRIIDLIKVGLVMKIIGIVIILFASMIWLSPIFRIHQITPFLNNTFLINNGTSQ